MKPDPLFKGLTRPALWFGMPFQFALFGLAFSVIAFVTYTHLLVLAVGLAITWFVGRELGTRDPDFLTILWIKIRKTEPVANKKKGLWPGNSYKRE